MAKTSRISKKIAEFVLQMQVTDDLQLSILTPPSTKRFTLWGWSADESAAWTAFRTEAEVLYQIYGDPDKVTSAIRNKLKTLIINVNKYDHDPTLGHKLLDRVALLGTVDDCKSFNIKRSTSLAKVPIHGSGDPLTLTPRVGLKEVKKGMHVIDVDEPTMPGVKGKPKGVLAILIFCYIGQQAPTSNKQYSLVGAAIRGRFIYKINDVEVQGSVRLYAFYCARYLTTTGILGEFGNEIAADVMV
jgi:hypothetical protein